MGGQVLSESTEGKPGEYLIHSNLIQVSSKSVRTEFFFRSGNLTWIEIGIESGNPDYGSGSGSEVLLLSK